jgi:CRP-like cAMP-binding protein
MSKGPGVAELLARTPLFGGLSDAVLSAIAAAMRNQSFTAGQLLFSRNEAGAGLYLVTAGRVRLSVKSEDGRELTLRMAERGDVIGEIAALDNGPRTADATAVGTVEAGVLGAADLALLMDNHPAIARTALKLVCSRLRDTTSQLEEIALYPIEKRVARFLLSALAFGGHDTRAAAVPLDLKMNQTELALLLGASRPKVNVALGALEKANAINRKGETIVCHPAALAAYAGGG